MKFFFSCDWGTTAFRLRLVDANNLAILSEIKTANGIAATFERWKKANLAESERIAFFQTYLFEQVKKITDSTDHPIIDTPIIISGMASSSIGMVELPYKQLPFQCNGSDLVAHTVAINKDEHSINITIISGACSAMDVLRGEETMLAGCDIPVNDVEQVFIFPGTHSKHMWVKDGRVINLTTYMTGELFDLLSNKSILSASVKRQEPDHIVNSRYFIEGVLKGSTSTLSNSIFYVRTNQLFGKASLAENYDYLSGLLIGHELKDIKEHSPARITLVCGGGLKQSYRQALLSLDLHTEPDYKDADEALIKGQWTIVSHQGNISA